MSLYSAISGPTFESAPRSADPVTAAPSVNRGENVLWGEDGLQFGDVLDSINPLQHIPIVSLIYRQMFGDKLAPGARIAGGSLFGGPAGFLSGLITGAIESTTGKDIGGHLLGLLPGGDVSRTVASLSEAAAKLTPFSSAASAGADQAGETGAAPHANGNTLALAALQRDVRFAGSAVRPNPQAEPSSEQANFSPPAADPTSTTLSARSIVQAKNNIFAVPLPPVSGGAGGPSQGDGRKANEYSAPELASILLAYQRAGDVAVPPKMTRMPRVEG